LIHHSHRIVYRVSEKQVDIVAVVHGAKPLPDESPDPD